MSNEFTGIPEWVYNGTLPAFDAEQPTSRNRSPYSVSLTDLIQTLGRTEDRRRLLEGLLNFRSELHRAGIERGFQWISGSFIQNVEAVENRSPNDIDVVTFFHFPGAHTAESLIQNFPELFDRSLLKLEHAIDSFYVQLDEITPEEIIREATYWHSLWSRSRAGEWKGYLQIGLSSRDDAQARLQLAHQTDSAGLWT